MNKSVKIIIVSAFYLLPALGIAANEIGAQSSVKSNCQRWITSQKMPKGCQYSSREKIGFCFEKITDTNSNAQQPEKIAAINCPFGSGEANIGSAKVFDLEKGNPCLTGVSNFQCINVLQEKLTR